MMQFTQIFQGSFLFLLIFIVPLWLFLHYRLQAKKTEHGINDTDIERLEKLQNNVKKLQERVQTLELILDEKVPEWRRIQ
ncbi:envelope stress response membrane protein PspB [Candidatus Venteria ishoeyi]|uniref:Phage shock protein B n=1 Tax=Candidatus Venteria ishoeyi TaxID=1899563 RepID=A0A1H6FAU4_9GAMM|nr:envelope stress response membrane protein PspB [Candidatus Venteria ishoeyi]MDM8545346.1 envelope stress response membrane protein PspB [Candidatus Venteria ishoeyi]SEH07230.1 Phage shock protein B [Candidatus Venteria ishoeyi]